MSLKAVHEAPRPPADQGVVSKADILSFSEMFSFSPSESAKELLETLVLKAGEEACRNSRESRRTMSHDGKKPLLIVISGPSGSGKTTIAKRLVSERGKAVFSVSHTTRLPRPGEKDGRDYHFVNEKTFLEKIEKGEFLEWAKVHNSYYGTHISEWVNAREKGMDLVLDIDVRGGMQVVKTFPEALLLFILPPSFEEMLRRVSKREKEKGFDLHLRLKTALKELDFAANYHYNVENKDLPLAVEMVKEILAAPEKRGLVLKGLLGGLKNDIERYLRKNNV